MLGCIGTNHLVPCLIALACADENHSMSQRLLRQIEAALTLVCSSLAISPLATCAGVEGLDREEIASSH